ncbi:MAG: serine hydrolase domain-containing protein, partial [Bacteroidota bacterium]
MKRLFLSILGIGLIFQLSAQTARKLESAIDEVFGQYENKPGCAVAIVRKGETVFKKGYGLANLAYEVPVTTSTVFDAAQVSKQVTAACIFMLVQEGLLKLDDPVQKFIPEITTPGSDRVTITNLLQHTSGFRSYYATMYAKNEHWGDSHDNEDAITTLARHQKLNFTPGTRHYYNSINYILLGSVVARVSGQSLASYAKEKLFDPLGMKDTFYKDDKDQVVKNVAIGYQPDGDVFKELHHYNTTIVGDAGLHTTIDDFIKWSNNLETGSVGGEAITKDLIRPGQLSDGRIIQYAGGIYNGNHQDIVGLPRLAHRGYWAGFHNLYYKFLNQDVAFIIFS